MTDWKNAVGAIVFAAAVLGGLNFYSRHRVDLVYVEIGDGRQPAAVRRELDLSHLDGLALSQKINERLVGDAQVMTADGRVGLRLGQFVIEGEDGRKRLACSRYDRIEMVFMAEGVADAGQVPMMVVEGNCQVSEENLSWIRPIWIPVGEITTSVPGNKDLNFYDHEPVSVRFTAMGSVWPQQWVLKGVRLFSSAGPGTELVISNSEIRNANPRSIILQW